MGYENDDLLEDIKEYFPWFDSFRGSGDPVGLSGPGCAGCHAYGER